MRLICSLLVLEIPTDQEYKMLAFKNLRELSIKSCLGYTTILPPPEFLSSITSTQLSKIVIDLTELSSCGKLEHHHLRAIRGYDEALCQLSNQLGSSSGGRKLAFTVAIVDASAVPDGILPRFSDVGDLEIVGQNVV